MSDIFAEVEDELRAERTRRFLRRYGWTLGLAAVVTVIVVGVYQWQYDQRLARAKALGGMMMDAMARADAIKPADPDRAARLAAADAFAKLADEPAAGGYRTLAKLRQAGLLADAGQPADAAAVWDSVADDVRAEPMLRQLAAYQAATHYAEAGAADAPARLDAVANSGSPFHALAMEARAAFAIKHSDVSGARDILKRLSADPTATPPLLNRARGLLEQLDPGQ